MVQASDVNVGRDPYWHPRWTAFVVACLACGVLFAVLVLVRHENLEAAENYSELLTLVVTLFLAVVGMRGETWNPNGPTLLRRLTWAGRMMLLGVLFGFAVAAYQRLEIGAAKKVEEEKRNSARRVERREEMKGLRAKLEQTAARNKELEEQLKKALNENRAAVIAKVEEHKEVANEAMKKVANSVAGCPFEVRKKIEPELKRLEGALENGVSLNTRLFQGLEAKIVDERRQRELLKELRDEVASLRDEVVSSLARQRFSRDLLLRNWEGYWGPGSRPVTARFVPNEDGKLLFSARTSGESPAPPAAESSSVEAVRWRGGPFELAENAEAIEFEVSREAPPVAEVEAASKQDMSRSTVRLRLGYVLLSDSVTPGDDATLVLYARK
jgi:hypothetical protein